MRRLVVIVALSLLACSDAWTPPEDPVPGRILHDAVKDRMEKRYEEALAKHLWYHRHALEHNPGEYATRLSFALGYWHALGKEFPPALEKLEEVRDDAMERVEDGQDVRVSFEEFMAMNLQLGEQTRTGDAFVRLDAENPEVARQVYDFAEPALMEGKKYALCGKYLDPKRRFDHLLVRSRELDESMKGEGFEEEDRILARSVLAHQAARLVAILVNLDRRAEAEAIASESRQVWKGESIHDMFEKALRGEVPDVHR